MSEARDTLFRYLVMRLMALASCQGSCIPKLLTRSAYSAGRLNQLRSRARNAETSKYLEKFKNRRLPSMFKNKNGYSL